MIYGYARVSTLGQARDGNSLAAQESLLREHGASEVYVDHYTGATTNRPELTALLGSLSAGDTLIVTKLDRVARSITAGIELLDRLTELGVRVHILNMGVLDNSPTGRLIRNVLLSFAEFEREMIRERTMEGKAVKRQTDPDFREGRPPIRPENFPEIYKKQQNQEITVAQGCKILSIGRSTWYKLAGEIA